MEDKLNCYIHIPFCRSKCLYCSFASFSIFDKNKYIKYLEKEINNFEWKYTLNTIYFWWGTPSLLEKEYLERIFLVLKSKFVINKKAEITIESNPEDINVENLELWKNQGINRISLWVQTLNQKSLIEIKRDNKGDIFLALDLLSNYNFNLSLDFIIWLPFVKENEIEKDIEKILNKYDFIKHISVYMLESWKYPKNWTKNSIKEEKYVDEYLGIKKLLEKKEFLRYEISNFAKKWYESLHNSSYWNHSNYIWFWLGAHSFMNNIRFANSSNFNDYYSWKKEYIETLEKKDLFLEKIMFSLRTTWISKNDIKYLNEKRLKEFILDWYLVEEKDRIKLWDKWVVLYDYILSEIV